MHEINETEQLGKPIKLQCLQYINNGSRNPEITTEKAAVCMTIKDQERFRRSWIKERAIDQERTEERSRAWMVFFFRFSYGIVVSAGAIRRCRHRWTWRRIRVFWHLRPASPSSPDHVVFLENVPTKCGAGLDSYLMHYNETGSRLQPCRILVF